MGARTRRRTRRAVEILQRRYRNRPDAPSLFHLPFRQTEGFLNSLLGMMGIDRSAPDHTTLSRRSQHLDLTLRRVPPGEDMHLIVDSTGLSIVGEGEWAAARQTLGPPAILVQRVASR